MNKVILSGRITGNPNYSETESWTPLCTFGLAVRSRRRTSEGFFLTDVFRIVAWRELAERVRKELHRDDCVVVYGRAEIFHQEDSEGAVRIILNIVMTDFEYVGKSMNAHPRLERMEKPKKLKPIMEKGPF